MKIRSRLKSCRPQLWPFWSQSNNTLDYISNEDFVLGWIPLNSTIVLINPLTQHRSACNKPTVFLTQAIQTVFVSTTIMTCYCCNLSGGVALIVWFTTNGMCVKNNTIIYVDRASNSKRDCHLVALPMLTCERLNVMTSVREEILRAWSLLLLATTVRSFAHMPLGISDRNITLQFFRNCSF